MVVEITCWCSGREILAGSCKCFVMVSVETLNDAQSMSVSPVAEYGLGTPCGGSRQADCYSADSETAGSEPQTTEEDDVGNDVVGHVEAKTYDFGSPVSLMRRYGSTECTGMTQPQFVCLVARGVSECLTVVLQQLASVNVVKCAWAMLRQFLFQHRFDVTDIPECWTSEVDVCGEVDVGELQSSLEFAQREISTVAAICLHQFSSGTNHFAWGLTKSLCGVPRSGNCVSRSLQRLSIVV